MIGRPTVSNGLRWGGSMSVDPSIPLVNKFNCPYIILPWLHNCMLSFTVMTKTVGITFEIGYSCIL